MSKFNSTRTSYNRPNTKNLAGGESYSLTPKEELISILLTSFLEDQFYRTASETQRRISELLGKVDPLFAAKLAIYARDKANLRSVTHYVAAQLARPRSRFGWSERFYEQVVIRPDDILEILAAYKFIWPDAKRTNGKSIKLPNYMKDGLRTAFNKFDRYQLAKYRGEKSEFSLIDAVNLLHPKPTDRNAAALKALVNGTLRQTETHEARISAAAKNAEDEQSVTENKREVWFDMLRKNKLGYMALLRNINAILSVADDELAERLCRSLRNEPAILHSRILPYRIYTAAKALEPAVAHSRAVLKALDDAYRIASRDVGKLPGPVLICIDDSGSMDSHVSGKSVITCKEVAALIGATIWSANDADLMTFSDTATPHQFMEGTSPLLIVQHLHAIRRPNGTDFDAPFKAAKRHYETIIFLSDMQAWKCDGYFGRSPEHAYREYCTKFGKPSHLISHDLHGYGTASFNNRESMTIYGFSDQVFKMYSLATGECANIVSEIEAIVI